VDAMSDDLALLNPDQVCDLLQVKKSWLYDEVQAGRLKARRIGRQLRFTRGDLREYIERSG
jgi:excisionase family DNA binding protein